jgi:hypothetical protein
MKWLLVLLLWLYSSSPALATADRSPTYNIHKQDLLLLDLSIDRLNETIKVKSFKRSHGFLPDYKNPNAADYLPITVGNRSFLIPLPMEQLFDETESDGSLTGESRILKNFEPTVILPYQKEAKVNINKPSSFKTKKELVERVISFTIVDLPVPVEAVSLGDYTIETLFDGNPQETDPSKTLDIVFISSRFDTTDYQAYRDFTYQQTDGLFGLQNYQGKEPFPTYKPLVKIRSVFSSQNFDYASLNDIRLLLTSLGVPFDQVVVASKSYGRSYAYMDYGYAFLYSSGGGLYNTSTLLAHEFAHSFGGIMDEYLPYDGMTSLGDLYFEDLRYPNRNCKEDPEDAWAFDVPNDAYFGCSRTFNLYRSTEASLMRFNNDNYSFNLISQKLITQAFGPYINNAISLSFSNANIHFAQDLENLNKQHFTGTYLYNLGNQTVSYEASLEYPQNGLNLNPSSGTLDPTPLQYGNYLTLNIDFSNIPPGFHKNYIVITATNTAFQTVVYKIPVTIIYGQPRISPTLTLNLPPSGTVISRNETLPLSIASNIENPGWKYVVYLYSSPYQLDNNSNTFSVFASRAHPPYNTTFSSKVSTYEEAGQYRLSVVGITHFGHMFTSPTVTIDVTDTSQIDCSQQFYPTGVCSTTRYAARCFTGSSSCGTGYCCPPMTLNYDLDDDVDWIDLHISLFQTFASVFTFNALVRAFSYAAL